MSVPSDGLRGAVCLVTGGSGYLGQRICLALFAAGAREVRTLDLSPTQADVEDDKEAALLARVRRFAGDVRSSADVCAAVTGCSVVFHAASYGMSGREMLDRRKTRSVNLDGTATVLAAAQTLGVARLVYTSTCNSVFGGKPIYNGDESLPMFPPSRHVDEYSRTKALAERAVLAAHDPPRLATCALRCAAIYGPGETRHFPRIARLASLGAVVFSIGRPSVRVDWVHGDDLAAAHVLAAIGLRPGGPAGGQNYFISDGQPVHQTTLLMPLIRACGGLPAVTAAAPRGGLQGGRHTHLQLRQGHTGAGVHATGAAAGGHGSHCVGAHATQGQGGCREERRRAQRQMTSALLRSSQVKLCYVVPCGDAKPGGDPMRGRVTSTA